MASDYRIFGSEMSPYSVKVRSYFRYKGLPHRWLVRNTDTQAEYQAHAKIQIIPLVVTPTDEALQDSTPIIERLERDHPTPSIHPGEPVTGFLSALLEEFGDEWGNKWMFHYRWAREVDQISSAGRIARGMMPAADRDMADGLAGQIRGRMVGRVWFVGSSPQTAPQIEDTFATALALLDAHLATRPYLFGARPSFGDFGLWGQIYEAWTDPTAGALIEGRAHHVLDWVHRMLWPRAGGDFESWETLAATLAPFLQGPVAQLFLPWTLANAAAVAGAQEEFTVQLAGQAWTQKPQKYHAKSLQALRAKYAAITDRRALDAVLDQVGCRAALAG
jgi:glutathione S-transferase